MTWRLLPCLVLAHCLLAGAAVAQTDRLQLGKNLGGENCRIDSDPIAARSTDIFCGDNVQSVGRLELSALNGPLPGDATARREAVRARADTISAALSVSGQLSCDSGQFLGGGDVLLFVCTMPSTSWPHILLISGSDRTMVQAEGMPSMLPVLASAISMAMARPVEMGDVAAGESLLGTRVPAKVLRAATADFARDSQSIEAARAYSSRNDFAAAETALRGALTINSRLFGPESVPVGLALMELAMQVSNQGRFDEAAGLFRRASPIIEASVNADARAQFNSYLALDAANQRDFAKALTYARQATAERRAQLKAANGGGDSETVFSGLPAMSSGELAHSLRIEAEMALKLGDLPNAQAAAEEALWIVNLEPGLALWWRADVVSLMAEINEKLGRVSAAERNYRDAIALRQKLFGDSAPLVLSHLMAGRFYTEQQLYPQALDHFRLAMAILARSAVARARVMPDQLIPFITAAASITAGPQQRAMLDTEIFRATQLVNSDVADQAIARASVRLAAANPALADLVREAQDAQRSRDQLRMAIAAELTKAGEERDPQRETRLAQLLASASDRADTLGVRVQKEFPEYARLASPEPVELTDLRAQLRPRQALLSFVVGYRESYGLLATQSGLTVKKLDVTSTSIAADVALLRRAFVPQLGTLPDYSLRNAYTLYGQLLAPFADDLKGVDELVVAPGPGLSNLPFSLLVTSPPAEGEKYADAAWLIRQLAVSQVPSARAFFALRQAEQKRQAAPRPFLGLADPLLGASDSGGTAALASLAQSCREASPMPAALLRALSPLHDTAEEVRNVARALDGTGDSILLGAAATETGLRSRPLDQYRVLYFATHGLLPGELHCQAEPGLVLSPPANDAAASDADGLLESGEIATLRLNADLVVLSACNTGAAGTGGFGGSALEGLADAFFNAGARGVLASHWEVPSAATSRLMTSVFQHYGQDRGRGMAEALRQSQLEFLRDSATAHPFYWAAFTLIGVGNPGNGLVHTVQQVNGGAL